ncbi:DUF4865 family protein [Streptomyces sp. McG7]|nr:DUF4865 family protein [Streptomyces sp. McG7]
MLTAHCSIPLPADYDMDIVVRRVADRSAPWDERTGLLFKAFCITEAGGPGPTHNSYAPFYVWAAPREFARFLNGAEYAGLCTAFGPVPVRTGTVLQCTVGSGLRGAVRSRAGHAPRLRRRGQRPGRHRARAGHVHQSDGGPVLALRGARRRCRGQRAEGVGRPGAGRGLLPRPGRRGPGHGGCPAAVAPRAHAQARRLSAEAGRAPECRCGSRSTRRCAPAVPRGPTPSRRCGTAAASPLDVA